MALCGRRALLPSPQMGQPRPRASPAGEACFSYGTNLQDSWAQPQGRHTWPWVPWQRLWVHQRTWGAAVQARFCTRPCRGVSSSSTSSGLGQLQLGESALVLTALLGSETPSWRAGVALEVVLPSGPLQVTHPCQWSRGWAQPPGVLSILWHLGGSGGGRSSSKFMTLAGPGRLTYFFFFCITKGSVP